MRAMTVRQPWAWAIIHGGKDVENRTRNIAGGYRGPVAIHAGLAKYEQGNDASRAHRAAQGTEVDTAIVFGAIIGVVDLVDVHSDEACWQRDRDRLVMLYREDPAAFRAVPDSGAGGLVGRVRLCSAWAMHDHHHLAFENPRPLAEPIPWRGQLGLWTLPDDIAAAIREQVQR